MNRFTIILICILFSIACNSCKTKQNRVNVSITGTISNATRDYVVLSQNEFNDTCYLSAKGNFEFTIYTPNPDYYLLRDGKSSLRVFVEPNDRLHLKYNAKQAFKTIEFSGSGTVANTYLKDKYLLMLNNPLSFSQLLEMPFNEFRYQVDSQYVIHKMFLEAYIENKELPAIFVETELASLKYERATQLFEYLINTPNQDEKNYLKFMDELSVNKAEYLSIYEYRSFLNAFVNFYSNKRIQGENLSPSEISQIKLQTISLKIENQTVKDQLLFTQLKEHIKYYGYKDTDVLFKTFEFQCENKEYLERLLTPYAAYKALEEKITAPQITMLDLNNNALNLNHFKGSYIYIDVWASWCLPCRKEAPLFERLKLKYAHKNVVFMSLSIDKTKEDWLEYLEVKKLNTDSHYWVPDANSFLDEYMIKTIPHFLIIDNKGNLIDNNANRPSDEKNEWLDTLPDKANV